MPRIEKCHTCGQPVSSTATRCPHCGDTRTAEQTGILATFGFLLAFVNLYAIHECMDIGYKPSALIIPFMGFLLGVAFMTPFLARVFSRHS
jgi:hypothetical protein